MRDKFGVFIPKDVQRSGIKTGPLAGLTFGVKDVIAVQGHNNGAGNPDYERQSKESKVDSPVVAALLQAGANLRGMTVTDELMYSLNGENIHYGTPVNPHSEKRIPGGSSSGSAAAVAAEIVDFGIGTDTAGSVRIPSSYCGLYGFRPTHGSINLDGVIPLAKSFDTVGWMAKDSALLQRVGEVLLPEVEVVPEEPELLIDEQLVQTASPEVTKWVFEAAEKLGAKHVSYFHSATLEEGFETFRMIQGREIWQAHGEWIEAENPIFAEDIGKRLKWAKSLNQVEMHDWLDRKAAFEKNVAALFKRNTLLLLPTAAGPAPVKGTSGEEMERLRSQTMTLTSVAGLTGYPQATVPIGKVEGMPIGLSAIAMENRDHFLLDWIQKTFY